MRGPAVREGCVLFSGGRILEVGPTAHVVARHPDATVVDRAGCTVLPGLVNAHTHLELSEFRNGEAPASFVDWIGRLVPRGQVTADVLKRIVSILEKAAAEIDAIPR